MDRIRFQAHERLDLVDADALQDLVYQYVGECIGGLMGNSAGALTSIEFTHDTNDIERIFLKPFQYYHCEPQSLETLKLATSGTEVDVPKRYSGKVVSFNPDDEGQTDDVPIWTEYRNMWVNLATAADNTDPSTLYPHGSTSDSVHGGVKAGGNFSMPILWAQPYEKKTDEDARREWSVAEGIEKPITMKTRMRVRSHLQFSTERPPHDLTETPPEAQWVAVARVTAWIYPETANPPTGAGGAILPISFVLSPIYVWDNHFLAGDVGGGPSATAGEVSKPFSEGVAKFSSESGTRPDANMWLAKPPPHGPLHASSLGTSETESSPFENNGAVCSSIARGNWLPEIGGAPANKKFVGGNAQGDQPLQKGSTTAYAQYPYPGSFYRFWDTADGGLSELDEANNSPDNERHLYGALAEAGWISLGDEGLNVDSYALWRLGIPQVMHLMRRQIAFIMDSHRPVEQGDQFGTSTDDGGSTIDYEGEITTGRPWYALPTDTGGLLQLRGSIAALTKRTDEQHLETVRHVRREIGGTDSLKGCFIAAAGHLSVEAGQTNPTFDGFGLTLVSKGNSEDVGSYYTWKIIDHYKILSVQMTQNPYSTENGIVRHGQTAAHKMPVAYVSPGNQQGSQINEQFTIYTAQSSMAVLDGGTVAQELGSSPGDISLAITGGFIAGVIQIPSLAVDFGKTWTEKDTRHDYYITVLAERVLD